MVLTAFEAVERTDFEHNPPGADVRTRKRIKRAGEVALVESLVLIARAMPRRMGSAVFAGIGAIAARAFPRDRHRAAANLALAFPEVPSPIRDALARASFKALGRNAFEMLRLANASPERVRERVERVEGMEYLLDANRPGKGVIAITGHIGCWELLPAYFITLGYTVSVVARRMKSGHLNAKLVATRASVGVTTLDRDDSPRRMLELLRRGEALGVLIDQHTNVAGAYVPFFDRPAFTPTAVAKLAMASGAAILPMAIFRAHSGRYVIRVLPAIPYRDIERESASKEAAIRAITAQCSLAVERLIRLDPAQWVWFHNRWREPKRDETVQVAYVAEG